MLPAPRISPGQGRGAFWLFNSGWSLFVPIFVVSPNYSPRAARGVGLGAILRTDSRRTAGHSRGAAPGRGAPGRQGLAPRRLGGSLGGAAGGSVAGAEPGGDPRG